ncbi:MAG: hypothetical protein KF696_14110 [Planctomycetes bacterium]|nr:hypothetical protein [Planctomycetota bacterium]MCW8136871.1 hypothetical protein [Planctomycetota bacterium]
MSWQPYAMAAFALLVTGAVVLLLAVAEFDRGMVYGAGIGFGVALLLMLFNEFTTRAAFRDPRKAAALGHVLGGFLLRMVALAVGFFVLAFTGAGSPVMFALAFFAGVLLSLGLQVYRYGRAPRREVAAA